MSDETPRTCKVRKGMVLVYEQRSSSVHVTKGRSERVSYRLGTCEATSREGVVRAIKCLRYGSPVYDNRKSGYSSVTMWRMIPELEAADVAHLGEAVWTSLDEAKDALRPLVLRKRGRS